MGNANWLTVKIGLDIIIPVTGNRPNAPVLFQREAQVFFCFLNLSMVTPIRFCQLFRYFAQRDCNARKNLYICIQIRFIIIGRTET